MRNPVILALSVAAVLSIILPLSFPHITRTLIIYHLILHGAGVAISASLSVVSIVGYKRVRKTKVLFMTLGFVTLFVSEILYFIDSTELSPPLEIPGLHMEMSHVIAFCMLVLFGAGALRVEKKREDISK